jgi:hypothetical protein
MVTHSLACDMLISGLLRYALERRIHIDKATCSRASHTHRVLLSVHR